jgi:hypothetical protein
MGKWTEMRMNTTSVSRDSKWVVCGHENKTTVWDEEIQKKIIEVAS